VPLERFSAAWREEYVTAATASAKEGHDACVFCALANEPVSVATGVLQRGPYSFVTLNAFPYGSGHLLVLPRRHESDLEKLSNDEYADLSRAVRDVVAALKAAYEPDGLNVGYNLGHAAGAGIPEHLHAHVLPRWNGDTNFMTTIGETRVLPESLVSTWNKVHAHLPSEVE